MVFFGLVAFSHDRKFLGSIAHDQMLKVLFFLNFQKNYRNCFCCSINSGTFTLGTHLHDCNCKPLSDHFSGDCGGSARAENEKLS